MRIALPVSDAAPPVPPPTYAVSVKSLCAFAAKAGDLDFRFAPTPSAREGMAGHSLVQSRRGDGYICELALSSTFEELRVRGRADGYDAGRRRVEEIKTFRGDVDRIKGNHRALHWAQARTYGAMLCERDGLDALTVALVYVEVTTGEETVLETSCSRVELREGFERLCAAFIGWARQEAEHRSRRNLQLGAMVFPHADFRAGQRELSRNVYRAASAQRCLLAQAPTGIGKTVATTYPLLRGCAAHKTDKIFFLTAKTTGRQIALEALWRMGMACNALRVLELTARAKACERPGAACNGDSCSLARGFYDRLPSARRAAAAAKRMDRAALRSIALAHEVCPYFLGQEMV